MQRYHLDGGNYFTQYSYYKYAAQTDFVENKNDRTHTTKRSHINVNKCSRPWAYLDIFFRWAEVFLIILNFYDLNMIGNNKET